jgi:uncharacterized protein (DUF2237 family)
VFSTESRPAGTGRARRGQGGEAEGRPRIGDNPPIDRDPDTNVVGGSLLECSSDPMTGFFRDGCCATGPEDLGSHTVCAIVSVEFLQFSRRAGNDLSTPQPQFGFPGLSDGDRWCVCAARWLDAHRAGVAPPVVLAATHEGALEVVPIELLLENATEPDEASSS